MKEKEQKVEQITMDELMGLRPIKEKQKTPKPLS